MSDFATALNQFADRTYQAAKEHGFYPCGINDMWKKFNEEATEFNAELYNFALKHPYNIGEEAADVIITVLNICKALGIDIGQHVIDKAAKNETRPYLHGRGPCPPA